MHNHDNVIAELQDSLQMRISYRTKHGGLFCMHIDIIAIPWFFQRGAAPRISQKPPKFQEISGNRVSRDGQPRNRDVMSNCPYC